MRAEAEVRPAQSKRDVAVGGATDVEPERIRELLLVAVGRDVPEKDLVALPDRAVVEFDVARGRSAEVQQRAAPAEHLFHRCLDQRGIVAEAPGDYGDEGYVYQAIYRLPEPAPGCFPVIGSWVVDGEPAGMGIREDGLITGNTARFVPHIVAA